MEQRPFGGTGLMVSALGFGCGNVGGLLVRGDATDQRRAVARAIEAGVSYFDTAPLYGNGRSEENLGRVLRELGASDRVTVGTKVRLGADDLQEPRSAVRRSIEASLRRLGRDSVDLLQLHNPILAERSQRGDGVDTRLAIGAIADGLRDVVEAGLARHAGFTGLGDTVALHEVARSGRFESMQSYFNILNPSAAWAGATGDGQDFVALSDMASGAGLGVIAIRVMAAGAVSGVPERAVNAGDPGGPLAQGGYARDIERSRSLESLALQLGLEGAPELALRFVLSEPGISTALVGFSNLDQLESAIRWAERGPLALGAVRLVVEAAG
jgi:aryl-alcohol dehydrogenase-like predicted oxidoreductase